MEMGSAYTMTDHIVAHPNGKPIYPEHLSQMLTILTGSGRTSHVQVPRSRHLFSSIMLLQGVNVKVIQEHLGHKDIYLVSTMSISDEQ